MQEEIPADEIFKEFKEHSIAEFFRKNRQMLGYAGKVRSLTTIVHEYVTNSLDACEESGVLPEILIEVKEINEDRYSVKVSDNGPGIPKSLAGKALAEILAGTKFHRYIQQRGQQGIGAAGCTLYAQITTGKPIHLISTTTKESYECDIAIDIKSNKPVISNMSSISDTSHLQYTQNAANATASGAANERLHGTTIYGEFGDTKYENSDHGVYEYIKRTALANPHASFKLIEPNGKEYVFLRSSQNPPKRPRQIRPHPLGLSASDLFEFAHMSDKRNISSFIQDTFSRVSPEKVKELKGIADIDFSRNPKEMTWSDVEKLVSAFKKVKWLAPDLDSLSTIGEEQMKNAITNILAPDFVSVIERKPKVFSGGIPFVVEAAIAYGGGAGKKNEEGYSGSVLRFSNKVPLLFDSAICAITYAVNGVDWKRYGIANFDEEPISVMVNVSSVYVPYSGVGKQAIAQEDEIIDEIRLAVMEAARGVQRHISNVRSMKGQESKYKTIMRYVEQLSADLSELTGKDKKEIEESIKSVIDSRYKKLFEDDRQE